MNAAYFVGWMSVHVTARCTPRHGGKRSPLESAMRSLQQFDDQMPEVGQVSPVFIWSPLKERFEFLRRPW
jgi:hypothetical protein